MQRRKKSNTHTQEAFFPLLDSSSKGYPLVSDQEREKLLLAILAFSSMKGAGFKTLCSLFDKGILSQVNDWSQEELTENWIKLGGNFAIDLRQDYAKNRSKLVEQSAELATALRIRMITFIPIGHRDYPNSLFRLTNPPRWLFVQGDINAVNSPSIVAIIGTRSATIDGQRLAYYCSSILARRNVVVLSGLASGIDTRAHSGAVDFYGVTIAVLGFGIDLLDSKQNEELIARIIENDGAIISEYLPSDPGTRSSFLRRNELQAALSKVVIPIECPKLESGTGATIRRAVGIGTPVIGVSMSLDNIDEKNLFTTRENLLKLRVPIFSLNNGEQIHFWNFINRALPDHDWQSLEVARQDRFFRVLEKAVIQAQRKLELDGAAIDRLAKQLKKIL